ncbi:MAG: hypothetical protein WC370_08370 [Dehalococcoidales bacterium]|jgi:hypothetical protein
MIHIRKCIALFLTALLLLPLGVSCDKETITSSSGITSDAIKVLPPGLNMFISPEIKGQEKIMAVSSQYDWTLQCDAAWLEISPKSGPALWNTKVTVKIKDETLPPGAYITEISIKNKAKYSISVPVELEVLTEQYGQIFDIPVEMTFTDLTPGATEFSTLTVKVGTLQNPVSTFFDIGKYYAAGDPCIIVCGEFRNNTDNTTYITMRGTGYDAAGTPISRCLSVGRLEGMGEFSIPAHGSTAVELLMSWSGDLAYIEISTAIHESLLYPLPTEQ